VNDFEIVRKISALTQPASPCGHTLNFEKSVSFLNQKVRTSAFEETPLSEKSPHRATLLTADIFYGQPLTKKLQMYTFKEAPLVIYTVWCTKKAILLNIKVMCVVRHFEE